MTLRDSVEALAPALCAAVGGGAAVWAGAQPVTTAAMAVLGAASGAVLFGGTGHAAPVVRDAVAPVPLQPESHERALIEAMPGAVLVIGADRLIKHANPDAVEMFGLPQADPRPMAVLRARRLLDRINMAFQHGTAGTLEFSMSRASELHLLAHVKPVAEGDVLVAILDQTNERKAQESHRDFVANASHELKTPLAAVAGIIETLLGHARDDPEATVRFLGLLDDQTQRMTRLTRDLLSLNRVELNERMAPDTPHDMVGLLSETVDALGPMAAARNVTLSFAPPAEPVMALADRGEISQLFRNLIENAIKYGGRDGVVAITMRTGLPEHPGMLAIAVRDEGPGIAREHLPRLTERFYRVNVRRSREQGGTGLGLAICKHIANRHRGQLQIRSRVGEGSTFTVLLPVLSAAPAAPPALESVGTREKGTRQQ